MTNDHGGLTPRVMELMQQELDGANTAAERNELEALMRENAVARRTFEELRAVALGLERIADVSPPPELRRLVLAVIAARPEHSRRPGGGLFEWLRPGRVPVLKYALIFVAAAGLAVLVGRWAPLDGIKVDGRSVSGTLAPAPVPGQALSGLATATVRAAGVTGTVGSVASAAGIDIVFDIKGDGPLQVAVDFDPALARFAGAGGGASVVGEAGGGRFRIDPAPDGTPFAARFERVGDAGTTVRVELRRGDVVLQQWTFEMQGL